MSCENPFNPTLSQCRAAVRSSSMTITYNPGSYNVYGNARLREA
jgi:hypothetical protein